MTPTIKIAGAIGLLLALGRKGDAAPPTHAQTLGGAGATTPDGKVTIETVIDQAGNCAGPGCSEPVSSPSQLTAKAPEPGTAAQFTTPDGVPAAVYHDGVGTAVVTANSDPAPASAAQLPDCPSCAAAREAAKAPTTAAQATAIGGGQPVESGVSLYSVTKAPTAVTQSRNLMTLGPQIGAVW